MSHFGTFDTIIHTDRQTNRQIDRQTDRLTDRQTDRLTDRQTDRQTAIDDEKENKNKHSVKLILSMTNKAKEKNRKHCVELKSD